MNLKEAPAKQGKTSLRLAAEMALKRLERSESELHKARAALRQALAQPVDAVNMTPDRVDETVKREHEWVGLSDEEVFLLSEYPECCEVSIRKAEAKLKEKNGG
jgi:hypothetical protein